MWRVSLAWWARRAWQAEISPCVAMPAFIAPSASMAAQDECAPLCAIEGMLISHLPLRGDHRSLQSRRCSLIKGDHRLLLKDTHSHMHTHAHAQPHVHQLWDRRRSQIASSTCLTFKGKRAHMHTHAHAHTQATHTRTTKAITDRFLYHLVFRSKGKHSHMHAHAHAHTCLSTM